MNKTAICFLCCCLFLPLVIEGVTKPDLVEFKNRLLKERHDSKTIPVTVTWSDIKIIAENLRKQPGGLVMVSIDTKFHNSNSPRYRRDSYKRTSKGRSVPRWKVLRNIKADRHRRIQIRIKEIKKRIAILEDKLDCEAYMEQMVFQRRSNRGPGDEYDYVISPEMDANRVRYISPDTLKKKWRTEIRRLKATVRRLQ